MSTMTRQPSPFTSLLMGLLPAQRKPAATLRESGDYAMEIARRADDIASAIGGLHRLPVAFAEIATRDSLTPETVAPRHRKPGLSCSNVRRARRLSFDQIVAGARA